MRRCLREGDFGTFLEAVEMHGTRRRRAAKYQAFAAFVAFGIALTGTTALSADPQPNAAERIAKVRAQLAAEDAAVRRAAIGSLVHSDISLPLLDAMQKALRDRDADVRSVAATAIGNLREAATGAVPALIEQLEKDPVKEARETAARALGRIGKAAPAERSMIGRLEKASREDADPVVRVVSLGALALIGEKSGQQIARLREFLHHDEMLVRMKAAHALGGLGTEAKAASAEIVEVLRWETDDHRRGYVARAVGSVGDPAALPALREAYAKEKVPGVQSEMRGAIRRLGGEVPK